MNFKRLFHEFSKEKKSTFKNKVDGKSSYYKIVMNEMASDLREYIRNDEYIVKPSVGQGNYADIPWICLLSTNSIISPSAQKGIYIVLLFSKNGDEVFLCLSQGITNFKNMRLKPKELAQQILNTVSYFQSEIPKNLIDSYHFTFDKMNLGEQISTLAKGYIQTTIISKKYFVNDFNQDDFYRSLSALLSEYHNIIEHIGNKSYDDVIALINPQENIVSVDEAIEEIYDVLRSEVTQPRDVQRTPILVSKGSLKSNRYSRITQEKIYSKLDHIKQAKEHYQTGLMGEKIALELERNRLIKLGLDPEVHVKWCSVESDSYGYDIESVDYIDNKLKKIYIEVKATKDIKDTSFFVSKNEVEVSKQKKEFYRILRIFDINSILPKYYIADGEIEENFYLDAINFTARYKYEVTVS